MSHALANRWLDQPRLIRPFGHLADITEAGSTTQFSQGNGRFGRASTNPHFTDGAVQVEAAIASSLQLDSSSTEQKSAAAAEQSLTKLPGSLKIDTSSISPSSLSDLCGHVLQGQLPALPCIAASLRSQLSSSNVLHQQAASVLNACSLMGVTASSEALGRLVNQLADSSSSARGSSSSSSSTSTIAAAIEGVWWQCQQGVIPSSYNYRFGSTNYSASPITSALISSATTAVQTSVKQQQQQQQQQPPAAPPNPSTSSAAVACYAVAVCCGVSTTEPEQLLQQLRQQHILPALHQQLLSPAPTSTQQLSSCTAFLCALADASHNLQQQEHQVSRSLLVRAAVLLAAFPALELASTMPVAHSIQLIKDAVSADAMTAPGLQAALSNLQPQLASVTFGPQQCADLLWCASRLQQQQQQLDGTWWKVLAFQLQALLPAMSIAQVICTATALASLQQAQHLPPHSLPPSPSLCTPPPHIAALASSICRAASAEQHQTREGAGTMWQPWQRRQQHLAFLSSTPSSSSCSQPLPQGLRKGL